MAWSIRYRGVLESAIPPDDTRVGDLWTAPKLAADEHGKKCLSPKFFRLSPRRPPLILFLPGSLGPAAFVLDTMPYQNGKWLGDGWDVKWTGGAIVTVTPSINIGGGWHGYITGGMIGDDLAGRKFP